MKKLLIWVFTVLLIAINIVPIQAKTILSKDQTEKYLDYISQYQIDHTTNISSGSLGGEWTIIGLCRYGTISDNLKNAYIKNIKKKVKECKGIISETKYTEYSRIVLGLTAVGLDPRDIEGYNLLQPLSEFDNIIKQRLNGVVFALLALDSKGYKIQDTKKTYSGNSTTRDRLVSVLIGNQLKDGGWNIMGSKGETDITAMVLQALEPYKKEDKVETAIKKGLNCLGKLQNKNGGYSTGSNENAESTAQVLTAMSILNIDIEDSRFVKNNNTILDGLLMYYKDGAFKHEKTSDINKMATDQGFYSLVAYYRHITKTNSLYDMSDGINTRKIKYFLSFESNTEINNKQNNARNNSSGKNKKTSKKNVKTSQSENSNNNSTGDKSTNNNETNVSETTKTGKVIKNNKKKQTTIETNSNGETVIINKETKNNPKEVSSNNKGSKSNILVIILVLAITMISGTVGVIWFWKNKKVK